MIEVQLQEVVWKVEETWEAKVLALPLGPIDPFLSVWFRQTGGQVLSLKI